MEKSIKNKYYEKWKDSENEKLKLRTSKQVMSRQFTLRNPETESKEIMNIDPSMLEDGENSGIVGTGRFGTVVLKRFRSTPVAVKYFKEGSTPAGVEKEAQFLRQCCHLNLPIIYGMNISSPPYFVVTQFYGSNDNTPSTLQYLLDNDVNEFDVTKDHEQWLLVISQLADAINYLHQKEILHDDIKCDNILLVVCSRLCCPILIDFGKACLMNKAKRKVLTLEEQQKYFKHHSHIAPEVVDGTHTPSIKSDIYSVGIVVSRIYSRCKYRPLKEIARRCLEKFPSRCNTEQLMTLVNSFKQLN